MLGCVGLCCVGLGCVGMRRHAEVCGGMRRDVLRCVGLSCVVLGCVGIPRYDGAGKILEAGRHGGRMEGVSLL